MKKTACSWLQILLTISIVTSPAISIAQNINSPGNSGGNSTIMSDTDFIRKNIEDNIIEIKLAQLGKQKSIDAQIKTMAQQMIADHTQILTDLRRVGRQKNMTDISDTAISSDGNTGSGNTSGAGINSASGSGTDAAAGSSGTGVNSAQRTASGTSAAGMNSASSGNRALGTGMNSAARNATNTSVSGTNSAEKVTMASGSVATSAGNGTGTPGTGVDSEPASGTGSAVTTGTGVNSAMQSSTGTSGAATNSVRNENGGSGTGMKSAGNTGGQHNMQSMNPKNGMNGMQGMTGFSALQNASGTKFNTLFVSQMLQMHEAKIAELQTGLDRITDPILKSAVAEALQKIRMHRDMLAIINNGTNSNGQ